MPKHNPAHTEFIDDSPRPRCCIASIPNSYVISIIGHSCNIFVCNVLENNKNMKTLSEGGARNGDCSTAPRKPDQICKTWGNVKFDLQITQNELFLTLISGGRFLQR